MSMQETDYNDEYYDNLPKENDLEELKAEYSLSSDGDSWGNCMCWWFAAAGEMYCRDLYIPDEWAYRPGISPRVHGDFYTEACASATSEALMAFASLLYRLSRLLRHLGKDY